MLSVLALLAAVVVAPSADARGTDGACQQRVQDGGFEVGSPPWTQTFVNYTPLCDTSSCQGGGNTTGPQSGQGWVWFGGSTLFEQASVSQTVALPLGTAHLRFSLWIGASSRNGSDFMRVLLGGDEVFGVSESTPGFEQYAAVDVDVSAYATGSNRVLRFESTTSGPRITNFSVDNVSLETCPFPSLAISNAANVPEGDAGSTGAAFTVTLSEAVPQQVTVRWATANASSGTPATPDVDFTPGTGTLTFPSGTVSVPLAIQVLGDALDEFDERFAVVLSSPAGAVLGDGTGEATIVDDDPLPSLAISDATVAEGHTGTTPAQLTVTLTPASGRAVSTTFSTSDVSAVAGQDYTAASGPLTVPAGATTALVTVPVRGDVLDEADESFLVGLAPPDHAVLGHATGVVAIDDDDGPAITIADGGATEGDAGTTPSLFTLALSAPSPQAVTVDYTTVSGTAVAGADFVPAAGSVTFASGTTGSAVAVPVVGDVLDEPNEHFSLVLSNAADARLLDADARGVIADDDGGVLALGGELSHGFEQWRALVAPGARDLFVLFRPAFSSFEVVLDGASGDLGVGDGPSLRRLGPDLSTILQVSEPTGAGPARRLAVSNEQAVPEEDYVEVTSAGCTTDCGADDVYRIRVRETTLAAPRFNVSGGQVTVVFLLNRTHREVSGTVRFWASGAQLLAASPFSLEPLESLALNAADIDGLAGFRGSITVTHDGAYGALAGKAVSFEPATGMDFDTPFEVRRR